MPRGMNPNSRKALEENRHKGQFHGDISVESRQKAIKTKARLKTFREELLDGLSTQVEGRDGTGKKVKKTIQEIGTAALLKKYASGDPRVYELVRDTIGQKPVDVVAVAEIDQNVIAEIEEMISGQA